MKAKYKMRDGRCPMCNSENLYYAGSILKEMFIRYDYTCEDCGFVGGEDYLLKFAGHIAYTDKGVELLDNPKDKENGQART